MTPLVALTPWFWRRTTPFRTGVYLGREPWSGFVGSLSGTARGFSPAITHLLLTWRRQRHAIADWSGAGFASWPE